MLLAIAIGVVSGLAANAIGMPLPWMLGPMIGNTIAALASLPIKGPDKLRPFMIPIIGVLLGSAITPEVLGALGQWTVTFALLIPFLIVAAISSYVVYRRIGGYDPVTAYFCAMPGGLNDMLILGAEAGGVEKRIALAHAIRILIVILFVALFFGLVFGIGRGDASANWTAMSALTLLDYALLGACAVIGVPMGKLLRLPAAQIVGPMILSGLLHVMEIVTVAPPSILIIIAQIVIGTVIGCRFIGSTLREIGRDLMLGLGSSFVMICVAVAFAVLATALTEITLTQSFLAYSPGGLAEMSLLALALQQDPAFVSVVHVVRITLVIFAAAPIFRLIAPRRDDP